MPPKGIKRKVAETPEIHRSDFEMMLSQVPTDLFADMVNRSGIPPEQARELCATFKELKGE